jgi:hypothetical protein
VVATRSATRGKRSFQVRIKEIAVVAVEVKLPGAVVEQMAVTGIRAASQAGRQTLDLGIANTGDVLLKGSGSLVVSSASGRKLLTRGFHLDTFVPRTKIQFPVVVSGRTLPAGGYRALVTLVYGHGHHLARTLRFSIGSRQLAQLSHAHRPPATASRSSSPLLLILGGLGLVLVGIVASAMYFRAQGRRAALGAGSRER